VVGTSEPGPKLLQTGDTEGLTQAKRQATPDDVLATKCRVTSALTAWDLDDPALWGPYGSDLLCPDSTEEEQEDEANQKLPAKG
jgi:hypothetical protein